VSAMDSIAYDYDAAGGVDSTRPASARAKGARDRSRVLLRLLFAADVFASICAGLLTSLAFGEPLANGLGITAVLMVGSVLLAFVFGLYSDQDLSSWASGLNDAPRALGSALLLSWPVFAATELLGVNQPALVALVATTGTAGLDALGRALARGAAHRKQPLRQRTVIVGSGVVANRLAERLRQHDEFGLEPIGLVDDEVFAPDDGVLELPRLGSLNQLGAVLEQGDVDRVIIAFSRASHQDLLSCIRACRDHRVAVDIVPRLFELLYGARSLNQIGGLPLLSIEAPPLTRASRVAKRTLDIAVSGILLALLSPLLLLIAIAIEADSRGPVLFRQIRAGRNGKIFKVTKFRTMHRDAEERKKNYEDANEADDGVMFKIKDDPRITRVGGFLRRTSLDELPQLINVLTGKMSLVGPRPLILEEAEEAAQSWHARRLDLRPGITGLWQISGRSDLPFQEMVRFDYEYVSGWSLARDIEILLATIPAVLSGRGAY
jgi:exopolysaccharide biosynthesis polyprenyl glycosylphosphotransferase